MFSPTRLSNPQHMQLKAYCKPNIFTNFVNFLDKIILCFLFGHDVNSFSPSVFIADFHQCRLLNLTTYFEINLNKCCQGSRYQQMFFKYILINTFVLEKICADIMSSSVDNVMFLYRDRHRFLVMDLPHPMQWKNPFRKQG
jgi:hypothetical protein